jgi:hypothetical protein
MNQGLLTSAAGVLYPPVFLNSKLYTAVHQSHIHPYSISKIDVLNPSTY